MAPENEPLARPRKTRRWVEEVIQTSSMDCGPASLASLLRSHGVPASYSRLRELCQTDVDGTSIDTIEVVARELGLDAEQIMVPVDSLTLPEAGCLPALVVVRQPGGGTHFVVAWSRALGVVQIMDPAVGRRWESADRFASSVYVHQQRVAADDYRAWAESPEFGAVLCARMVHLGIREAAARTLLQQALLEPGWRSPAALDAAIREAEALVRARAVGRGDRATALVRTLHARGTAADAAAGADHVRWAVRALPGSEGRELVLRGAVLIRVRGLLGPVADPADRNAQTVGSARHASLSSSVRDDEPARPRVASALLGFTFPSGPGAAAWLVVAALVLLGAGIGEGLAFRGLLDIHRVSAFAGSSGGAVAAFALFAAAMLLVEIHLERSLWRLGRGLETRVRLALLERLPRVVEGYLTSLPSSDVAERSHTLHGLRLLPPYAMAFVSSLLEAIGLGIAVVVCVPDIWPLMVALAACGAIAPLVTWPALSDRDMRVRAHAGGLARFDLDALLGLVPIRAHGGGPALRVQHQDLLVRWARAQLDRARVTVLSNAVQLVLMSGMGIVLIHHLVRHGIGAGPFLLLAYWILRLPALVQRATVFFQDFPTRRNATLRALELLNAPVHASARTEASASTGAPGIAIRAEGAGVRAGGRPILSDLSFDIPAGTHVAIVGCSGAGKTSLIGLLLGWHRLESGQVLLDGRALSGEDLGSLRASTAWVDTAVRLWNRSLLDNVRYGNPAADARGLAQALRAAELDEVTDALPRGLQTALGEGGARLSGGEGQRVRLARAWLRHSARLVLLDEALRGLEPDRRRRLTGAIRRHWPGATVLAVTHDSNEALQFDRVMVLEEGRLVEYDRPECLARSPHSRFAQMVAAEAGVRARFASWKTHVVRNGQLRSAPSEPV